MTTPEAIVHASFEDLAKSKTITPGDMYFDKNGQATVMLDVPAAFTIFVQSAKNTLARAGALRAKVAYYVSELEESGCSLTDEDFADIATLRNQIAESERRTLKMIEKLKELELSSQPTSSQ